MAYIGKEPIVGNFQVCDAISVVNGQASYTMQVSSTNVVPESANHMLVSLNGILQKPNSSFTISGSTITFASNLATGDVIDFIMLLGNVLDIGIPSDSSVTDAKANFVSTSSGAGLQIKGDGTTDGTLQLNCSQNSHGVKIASPAHSAGQSYTLTLPTGNVTADKFLKVASVSGSGTTGIGQLSFADVAGGLSDVDMWRTSADLISSSLNPITSNIERVDNTEGWWDKIGTGMTQSSGIFTFPSTGIWLVRFLASIYSTGAGGNDTDVTARIDVTPDGGSNYYQASSSAGRVDGTYDTVLTESLIDCNNTSNVKVRFDFDNINTGTYLRGNTNVTHTSFMFIKLGDT